MIDVLAAALVEELSGRFDGPVEYNEEEDSIQLAKTHSGFHVLLRTFRENVRRGETVPDIATTILNLCKMSTEFEANPTFDLSAAIPHVVSVKYAQSAQLMSRQISPDLAVALAFNRPDSVMLPSYMVGGRG